MNTYQEILIQHCKKILGDRRIRNKIVVLCEGQGSILDDKTVANYGKMEQWHDAYFYRKCVPNTWTTYIPIFFNCKGRSDVIQTYFKLLELHEEDAQQSYLNPNKLFAIVDLDLQSQNIDNYHFSNTEEIFLNLYQQGQVNEENAKNHRIWVTGLIHKESYFMIPELQEVFLLMLKKVKDNKTQEHYWEDIKPPSDWTNTEEVFRDELLRQIAKFYSEQSNYTKYHIPAFMQVLKHFSTLN